ncbi:MAG: hypothetical protein P8X55_17600 [Desulfosarcinaceae bacterium]
MQTQTLASPPRRITDLVNAKAGGADVRLKIDFEILPTDFHHRSQPFKAYIFLTRYSGSVDGKAFAFRKCYARGCPNNLCTHVSQAVRIANRYLQRDFQRLKTAGLTVEDRLFRLDEMVVKFEHLHEQDQPAMTIPDLVGLAAGGKALQVTVDLAYLPAVEHFANEEKAQTFLSGEFTAVSDERTYQCHRCFACYPSDEEQAEKPVAVRVANARLELVYTAFQRDGIVCRPQYFS